MSNHETSNTPASWPKIATRAVAFILLLGLAYFLWTAHRAHTITALPWALFLLLHIFMHRHHGHGHGGHSHGDRTGESAPKDARPSEHEGHHEP